MATRLRPLWKSYWTALLRSKQDKRARSVALRITFAMTYALASIAVLSFIGMSILGEQGGVWTIAFYVMFCGIVATGFVMLRRSHRQQDQALNYSITGRSVLALQDADDISAIVRTYLAERAAIIGSLVARAASENHLRLNEVPFEQASMRQRQNAQLRQSGLLDKLEPTEADLVGVADGRWTVEQLNEVVKWCEQLRLLRWTLGIDAEMIPLAHFPRVDFSLSLGLLGSKCTFSGSGQTLKSWDLRVERDIAFGYVARVVAELKARKLITIGPELDSWADQLREKSLGPSNDYLVGSKTVGELDDDNLRLLWIIAVSRGQYAAYLAEQLSADNPCSFARWSSRA